MVVAARRGIEAVADAVEARLIEAVRVFDRMEGRGGTSFATDGPWRMMMRREGTDYWVQRLGLVDLGEAIEQAVRDPRPDAAMISRAEVAAGWLALLDEGDRALVLTGVRCLALGVARVPWTRLLLVRGEWAAAASGLPGTPYRLALRYKKALSVLAKRVDRAGW
jgi:hypothetical protein